jgi:ATP-binding cassette, subfamily B, bacterial
MQSFRKSLRFCHKYGHAFFRTIPFLWASSPKETLALLAMLLLQGVVPAFSIWLTKQVVDTTILALDQEKVFEASMATSLVAAWIGALFLQTLLTPWISAIQGNLGSKLTAHINLLLMQKTNSFPDINHFENPQFYDELQLIQQELEYRPVAFIMNMADLFRSTFTLIAIAVLLSPLGIWVPLLILATSIPQLYISSKYEQIIWETIFYTSPEARRMNYCSSVILTDAYAKEVRLFDLGSFFIHRYQTAFHKLYQAIYPLRIKQAVLSSGFAIVSILGNGFAFFWVVRQAFQGAVSPGNVIVFVQSLAYLQQNLEQFIKLVTIFYEVLLYMEKIFTFLQNQPIMVLDIPGESLPSPIRTGITFDNVNFHYSDGRTALTNISFTLYPGEIVAVVGENGAGKTTIVKLLTRLYDPTEGSITVDGIDLKNLNLNQWRQYISVIFQDFGRYALTLTENISLGNLKSLHDLELLQRAIKKAGMTSFVKKLPAKEHTLLSKQFGGTDLSGGEWQKLALARAFIREDAQLLILDEPTAALDPRSEHEVYQHFSGLAHGKTTLLITHRLASVQMADRILVLKSGALVEEGTHKDLLQQGGEYSLLWNMQAKQYTDFDSKK